jgi:hypothetical protein
MKQPSTVPAPLFMTASDVLALADHLEVQGTNRVMRNQESLEHHLGLSGLMLHLCRIRQGVRAVPPRMLAKISSAPFVRR